jgi:hypothetical protein
LHFLLSGRLVLQGRIAAINAGGSIAVGHVDYHQMTTGNRA